LIPTGPESKPVREEEQQIERLRQRFGMTLKQQVGIDDLAMVVWKRAAVVSE
jgi:hypothetical protein